MKIKWNQTSEFEVIDQYDEENDNIGECHDEVFEKDSIDIIDIIRTDGDEVDIQFLLRDDKLTRNDGMIFNISKSCFTVISEPFTKTTEGCVVQNYGSDGCCTEQSFIAGDTCEYENLNREFVEEQGETYQPFDMVQPTEVYQNLIVHGDVEPELSEPFENWDDMISAAEQHREQDPEKKDGIYHLTVPKGVHIEINTYSGEDK